MRGTYVEGLLHEIAGLLSHLELLLLHLHVLNSVAGLRDERTGHDIQR